MAHYFTERTVEGATGPVLVLTLRTEELNDVIAASECRQELSDYAPTGSVVVDLGNAPTIESSVIAGVLAMRRATQRAGCRLCVCNAGPRVIGAFRVMKLDQLLIAADSEEEAMRLVSQNGGKDGR